LSNFIKRQHVVDDTPPSITIGIRKVFNENENENYLNDQVATLEELEQKIYFAKNELINLQTEMKSLKEEALNEIQSYKENWELEKVNLQQAAYQEGLDAGKLEGRQIGMDEYKLLIEEAKNIITSSKYDYLQRIEESEETILNLGLKIASHILDYELNNQPDSIMPIVRKVIRELREEKDIRLKIHPEQYELVINQRSELEKILINESKLYIYPDETLALGSCIIESSFGRIDASVDVQLSEISKKLIEMVQEEDHATK
jgi:flagellar assembly protein FliH